MAIVNELGMEQLCAVMGSEASIVSLAACHLLQVMFEALTEGMKKEIRGKDEAILPGEFGHSLCLYLGIAACHQYSNCLLCVSAVLTLLLTIIDGESCTEPSKELRSMLRHLLEMMPASNVSGPGRDGAINLLVKQVPCKSLKNPDNSLTLWTIDHGVKPCRPCACSSIICFQMRFVTAISYISVVFCRTEEDSGGGWYSSRALRRTTSYRQLPHELFSLA